MEVSRLSSTARSRQHQARQTCSPRNVAFSAHRSPQSLSVWPLMFLLVSAAGGDVEYVSFRDHTLSLLSEVIQTCAWQADCTPLETSLLELCRAKDTTDTSDSHTDESAV